MEAKVGSTSASKVDVVVEVGLEVDVEGVGGVEEDEE